MRRSLRILSLLMLLLVTGTMQGWAADYTEFEKQENFQVTRNPDGSLHFKLLYATLKNPSTIAKSYNLTGVIQQEYRSTLDIYYRNGGAGETRVFHLAYNASTPQGNFSIHRDGKGKLYFNGKLVDYFERLDLIQSRETDKHYFECDWNPENVDPTQDISISVSFNIDIWKDGVFLNKTLDDCPNYHYDFACLKNEDPFNFLTLNHVAQADNSSRNVLKWDLYRNFYLPLPQGAYTIQRSDYSDFRNPVEFTVNFDKYSERNEYKDKVVTVYSYTFEDADCKNPDAYYRLRQEGASEDSYVNAVHSPTFIKDVCVSVANNATDARRQLTQKGYTVLPHDLNHGLKGKYVYLGYTRTNKVTEALTRLVIKEGQGWESSKAMYFVSDGYEMYPAPTIGGSNLNEGTDGVPLYLYYSRNRALGKDSTCITDITLRDKEKYGIADKMFVSDNANPVFLENGTDLNKGCGAGYDNIQLVTKLHKHTSAYSVEAFTEDSVRVSHDCCSFHALKKDYPETGFVDIATAHQLYEFARRVNNGGNTLKGRLVNDIVINKNVLVDGKLNPDPNVVKSFREWEPMGENGYYRGVFDGNGHKICGLYFDKNVSYKGLFANTLNCTIKNVRVEDSYFRGQTGIGGITGYATNNSVFDNCSFDGVLDGESGIGGICGVSEFGSVVVRHCFSSGTFGHDNSIRVGGIVGGWANQANKPYSIIGCYSTAVLNGKNTGGIVGRASSEHNIIVDCYSTEKTVGEDKNSILTNCTVLPPKQFESGEAAYKMNRGVTDGTQFWGQVINEDKMPYNFSAERTREMATVYEAKSSCIPDKAEYVYTNYKEADGKSIHAHLTKYPAKTPTCTENGNLEYWMCNDCKAIVGDRYGLSVLNDIPVLACSGKHEYNAHDVCTVCGAKRQDFDTDAIDDVQTDGRKAEVYDLMGRRVMSPRRGLHIIKDERGVVRKVVKK